MFGSRTARRLFLQTAKTILMNYSYLDSHVKSKPRGETRMVPEVHSVANPFLFNLWSYDRSYTYRIACNFRGAKYSWFSWLEVWPRIFYPRMKRPCLPLPAVQAATTKILPTKCLNIAEPRIFYPPKITRYTVYVCALYTYIYSILSTIIILTLCMYIQQEIKRLDGVWV